MKNYIKSDLMRYYGKFDCYTFLKALLRDRTFRFQCIFRLCSRGGGIAKKIGFILWKLNRTKQIIQLPKETQVGYGLYIGHGGPIIINPTTVIGNNCNLSQFTTIGSNEGLAAVIGDNTYIGPNVCIVENVIIGNNVTIGAGSVVTKDIPDNATAVGNYAKVINYNMPGRFIQRRWKEHQPKERYVRKNKQI
jgi:serine O-acetyltransferase